MATLFHGKGTDYHPRVPLVDKVLSDRLQALGYRTKRYGDDCVFASTSRDQASDYARDEDHLFVAEPLEGAKVMMVVGCKDMIMKFESWLREKSIWGHRDGSARSRFISDVQGDIGTVETYLSLNRMKNVVSGLADEFLAEFEVREIVVGPDTDLAVFIGDNEGEVVVNGPIKLEPAPPAPAMAI